MNGSSKIVYSPVSTFISVEYTVENTVRVWYDTICVRHDAATGCPVYLTLNVNRITEFWHGTWIECPTSGPKVQGPSPCASIGIHV